MFLTSTNGTLVSGETDAYFQSNQGSILLQAKQCKLFLLSSQGEQHYVIPVNQTSKPQSGNDLLWVIPEHENAEEPSILLRHTGVKFHVKKKLGCFQIEIESNCCEVHYFENRPQSDFFGRRYSLRFEGGDLLARTLAAFYWDSMLPMVVERTVAQSFPFPDGYVLSTLQKGAYPGTYPDVDHEFQIKGRIAMSSELDLDIVKRMIELQLRVMRQDPEGKWRNPCSVQPKGNCEYHVSRKTINHKNEAIMFLLTGNIEIMESIWLYVAKTKDTGWLNTVITDLESVAGFVEEYIDKDFLLWSDVYYEDQVIKDGRETIAQAFAANGFTLLCELEGKLGRQAQSSKYMQIAQELSRALVLPLPLGYWDEGNARFVDWVDRGGSTHDHIHLLANELPLLFRYATDAQRIAVVELLERHHDVFQKFPSFVAAKIEDYTKDEIGDGGPYDLCAAGRYWCWDAEFWAATGNRHMLREQLMMVARQAVDDHFIMGERYDMNYVYYISKKMWHGAGHYYEYPNVFAWVLINLYLGMKPDLDADMLLKPQLAGWGAVSFGNLAYSCEENEFAVTNHGQKPLLIKLDLGILYPRCDGYELPAGDKIRLEPGETFALSITKSI